MIVYHQTSAEHFRRFDLSKCRNGHFGVGIYFYLHKPQNAHYAFCDVKLKNPMLSGKKVVSLESWEKLRSWMEDVVQEQTGERISVPSFEGLKDIEGFKWLCNIYEGNVAEPDWVWFLSKFVDISGCDGYLEEGENGFAMSFCPEEIAIICWF